MNEHENALPAGGAAKPAQNPAPVKEVDAKYRRRLLLVLCFCLFTVHSALWRFPLPAAGFTAAVFAWYILYYLWNGPASLALRSNRVLLLANLFLALTMALGSNWYFRCWNLLALLVLLPVHALSGVAALPWANPLMLWERFLLCVYGLLGNLWAAFAAASPARRPRNGKRAFALTAGALGAAALVALLLPVLASADALFAAATASLRLFITDHFSVTLWNIFWSLALTPFIFSFLYSLDYPKPLRKAGEYRTLYAEGAAFLMVLGALAALYLLFLAVQSAGLFGGPAYLAKHGISYAEWARSGFFQMVGVTAVNLTVILGALTLSRPAGRSWKAVRGTAALLVGESLLLLASAAWRMSLYVGAYGLSFKRCMTYWGMAVMALFFLTALWKIWKPDFGFCRAAFPIALAGWIFINCVPVDYLVAKNQVDRYLNHESPTVSIHYLLYSLSYDTLSQLDRLDGEKPASAYEGDWWNREEHLSDVVTRRRETARTLCKDWRTWSLSACLASM